MNLLAKTEVKINGLNYSIDAIQSLVVRQQVFGISTLELHLDETVVEGDNPNFMQKSSGLMGKPISVKVMPSEGNDKILFKGFITSISCHNSVENTSIVIKAESPEVLLNFAVKKKVFNDLSIKDIVSKVFAGYSSGDINLDNSAFGLASSLKTTIIQYGETDFQFIQRLADITGNWFFNDGNKTYFGKAPSGSAVELEVGHTLDYFEVLTKAVGYQYEASGFKPSDDSDLSSQSANPSGLDNLTQTIVNKSLSAFGGKNQLHLPAYLDNADLMKKYVDVRSQQQVAETNTVSGSSGDFGVVIGGKVKIKKNGSQVGEYRVVTLETILNAEGNYTNHFYGIAYSDVAPRRVLSDMRIPSEMKGRVTNVNDPDGLGRVKVKFDWQSSDGGEYGWVQVSSPSSGNDSGLYMRPEVNSWVVICLTSSIGLDDSYVLGAMHTGKHKPQRWKNKDNYLKGIRTNEGNEILLDDKGKDGKAISIQTSDDDQNYVWLGDSNGQTEIYLRTKNIKIMAEKDLEISAGGKLILQGTDVKISSGQTNVSKDSATQGGAMGVIELSSKGDVKVDAKMGFSVNATMDVKLTGLNVNATANAMMELSANATATLKSSAILTIQGTLVKIN